MDAIAYVAQQIFTGQVWLNEKAVIVKDGLIESVSDKIPEGVEKRELPECILAPAFIDLQIYGANKKLLAVHPTVDALTDLYQYCKNGGATHFLPTLATNTKEVFYKGIDAVRGYWRNGGKGILGLHLEGPWINKTKKGAHVEAFINSPDLKEVQELLDYGKDVIKMITLAPEVCSKEILELIRSYNIVISAGHSNCSFQQAIKGFENGVTSVTHLYNAMSGLQHREPGLVGAAFHHSGVYASIIADGHHVKYEAISIAKKIMQERLFAITDAITEADEGVYQHKLNGDHYVCNGTLSGSALTMYKAFENLVNHAGIETGEALRMCSLYPAKVMGIDNRYGKIVPGYAGQFLVLNKQLKLVDVIA